MLHPACGVPVLCYTQPVVSLFYVILSDPFSMMQFGSLPSVVPATQARSVVTSQSSATTTTTSSSSASQQLFQVVSASVNGAKRTFLIPLPPSQATGQHGAHQPTTVIGSLATSSGTDTDSGTRLCPTAQVQSKTSRGTPIQAVAPTPTTGNNYKRIVVLNRFKDSNIPKHMLVGAQVGENQNKASLRDAGGAVPDTPLVISNDNPQGLPTIIRYGSLPQNSPSKETGSATCQGLSVLRKASYSVRPTSNPIRNIFTSSSDSQKLGSVPLLEDTEAIESGGDNTLVESAMHSETNEQCREEELSIKIDSVFSLSGKSSDMAAAVPPLSPQRDTKGSSDTDSASESDGEMETGASETIGLDDSIRSAQKAVQQLQLEQDSKGDSDGNTTDSWEDSSSHNGDQLTSADLEDLPKCLGELPLGMELRFREARTKEPDTSSTGDVKTSFSSPVRAQDDEDLWDNLFDVISQDVTIPDAVPFSGTTKKNLSSKRTARKSCTGRRPRVQTARKSCTGFKHKRPTPEKKDIESDDKCSPSTVKDVTSHKSCSCGAQCKQCAPSGETQCNQEPSTGSTVRDQHSTVLKLLVGDEPTGGRTVDPPDTSLVPEPQWTPSLVDMAGSSILASPPCFWLSVPSNSLPQLLSPASEAQPYTDTLNEKDMTEDDSPPLELKISDVVSLRHSNATQEFISDTYEKVIFPKKRGRKKKQGAGKGERDQATHKPQYKFERPIYPKQCSSPPSEDSDDLPLSALKCSTGKTSKGRKRKQEFNPPPMAQDVKKEVIETPIALLPGNQIEGTFVCDPLHLLKSTARRGRKPKQKPLISVSPKQEPVVDAPLSVLVSVGRKRGRPVGSKNKKGKRPRLSQTQWPSDKDKKPMDSSLGCRIDTGFKGEHSKLDTPTKTLSPRVGPEPEKSVEIRTLLEAVCVPHQKGDRLESDSNSDPSLSVSRRDVSPGPLSELNSAGSEVLGTTPHLTSEAPSRGRRKRGRPRKAGDRHMVSLYDSVDGPDSSLKTEGKAPPEDLGQTKDHPTVQEAANEEPPTSGECDNVTFESPIEGGDASDILSPHKDVSSPFDDGVIDDDLLSEGTMSSTDNPRARDRTGTAQNVPAVIEPPGWDSIADDRPAFCESPLDRIQRLKAQLRQQEQALATLRKEREWHKHVREGLDIL